MKIVISGGSGLIGQALVETLLSRADVVVLTRNPSKVARGRAVAWDPETKGEWVSEVASADAVVNLAGAGIAERRWSEKRKNDLRTSRIVPTRSIVEALGTRSTSGRPVLVSASAVGYYGARGDEEIDELSAPGEGFLSEVSQAWEEEASRAEPFARVVVPRIGVVLTRAGGALAEMVPIFKLGIGGPLGSGRQWMSWIHVDDVVAMIVAAIDNDTWSGPFNVVAPNPVRNRDFSRALGDALARPAFLPAPGFAVRLVLGEMADALLLSGQRAAPARAIEKGFTFRFALLSDAFSDLFDRG